jgi:hypothetical protein
MVWRLSLLDPRTYDIVKPLYFLLTEINAGPCDPKYIGSFAFGSPGLVFRLFKSAFAFSLAAVTDIRWRIQFRAAFTLIFIANSEAPLTPTTTDFSAVLFVTKPFLKTIVTILAIIEIRSEPARLPVDGVSYDFTRYRTSAPIQKCRYLLDRHTGIKPLFNRFSLGQSQPHIFFVLHFDVSLS